MTQIEYARAGKVTDEMIAVAEAEGVSTEFIREGLIKGEIIILSNKKRVCKPIGIGKGLKTKINTNIGSSPDLVDYELEKQKAILAYKLKSDTIMDLSTGGDINRFRKMVRENFPNPMGTVPIYETAINAVEKKGGIIFMTEEEIFETIEEHAKDGVDFVTVHCGVTLEILKRLANENRVTDVVSRGGTFLFCWMVANNKENALFEKFDRLLDIAHEYDLTLSLGDGLRPGSIADATDRPQIQELILLGELQQRALKKGVQVMIEGPGHIPINEIEANVILEKKLCHNAPFYVLGPIVTDIAPGYDEITSAIGASVAAASGADLICYVTPSEHVGLPTLDEVRRGIIGAKIAAHIGDIAKGIKGAIDWDREMAKARKALDWDKQAELAIDKEIFIKLRKEKKSNEPKVCTMCGKYCSMKLFKETIEKYKVSE